MLFLNLLFILLNFLVLLVMLNNLWIVLFNSIIVIDILVVTILECWCFEVYEPSQLFLFLLFLVLCALTIFVTEVAVF